MGDIKVLRVRALGNYQLLVTFSNKENRIFDGAHLLSKPIFSPLINQDLFEKAYADYGGIVWNDDIDLSAEYIYEKSNLSQ